jgi:hypothetical protein
MEAGTRDRSRNQRRNGQPVRDLIYSSLTVRLTFDLQLDTAFKQQRLKAWQPILTPKSVLPTLFLVGLLFAPIGAVLLWGSNKVSAESSICIWRYKGRVQERTRREI